MFPPASGFGSGMSFSSNGALTGSVQACDRADRNRVPDNEKKGGHRITKSLYGGLTFWGDPASCDRVATARRARSSVGRASDF